MSKNTHEGVEPMKVYITSMDKTATVRKVENDPIWGPQYFVSTYSRDWGPEFFWVKSDDATVIVRPNANEKGHLSGL